MLQASIHLKNNLTWTRTLLAGGIVASLLYFGMCIVIADLMPGYNPVTQTISELAAIGTPTRLIWTIPAMIHTALVALFGLGVVRSSHNNHNLRHTGAIFMIYGVLGLGWVFLPMHQREVLAAGGGNFTDTMHIVFSFITGLMMLVAMTFGGRALGREFRIYTLITAALLIIFGILTSIESPNINLNQPTPMIGVWERMLIGLFLVWNTVLAFILLYRPSRGYQQFIK